MALRLITPPSEDPVSLEDGRAHLRLDTSGSPPANDDDGTVEALIVAATEYFDGRDGLLGRAIVTQTWELTLDEFPRDEIEIPLPPLQSIDFVKYIDTNGDEQTLTVGTDYTVDADGEPGRVKPVDAWPETSADVMNAVRIRFTAGYAPTTDSPAKTIADDVPAQIKRAILLLVGHWYQNREASITGLNITEIPISAAALVANLKVYR